MSCSGLPMAAPILLLIIVKCVDQYVNENIMHHFYIDISKKNIVWKFVFDRIDICVSLCAAISCSVCRSEIVIPSTLFFILLISTQTNVVSVHALSFCFIEEEKICLCLSFAAP